MSGDGTVANVCSNQQWSEFSLNHPQCLSFFFFIVITLNSIASSFSVQTTQNGLKSTWQVCISLKTLSLELFHNYLCVIFFFFYVEQKMESEPNLALAVSFKNFFFFIKILIEKLWSTTVFESKKITLSKKNWHFNNAIFSFVF